MYKGIDDFILGLAYQRGFQFGLFRISSEDLRYWAYLFGRIEKTNNPIRTLNLRLVGEMTTKGDYVAKVLQYEFSNSALNKNWKIQVIKIPKYATIQVLLTKYL